MSQIVYQILQSQHLDQTIACVTEAFVGSEPLIKSLKITEKEFHIFAEIFCQIAVRDRLSHVAIDSERSRVVGVAISQDYLAEPPEEVSTITEKFMPMIALIEDLKSQYARTRKLQKTGIFFYIFCLGVELNYRQQGIAKNLVKENVTNAKQRGFSYAVCESSNWRSQRTFFQSGFQEICAIEYHNNNNPSFEAFKSIKEEQKCMLMEKIISEPTT